MTITRGKNTARIDQAECSFQCDGCGRTISHGDVFYADRPKSATGQRRPSAKLYGACCVRQKLPWLYDDPPDDCEDWPPEQWEPTNPGRFGAA